MIAKTFNTVERNLIPFALCSTFVSFGTMLMGLTLFVLTGHCAYDKRFFPTISATELRAPEYYVYVVGFTYSAVALSLSIYVVHIRFIDGLHHTEHNPRVIPYCPAVLYCMVLDFEACPCEELIFIKF